MTVLVLANQVAGTVGSQTAVECKTTPFLPGRNNIVATIDTTGSGTAPDYAIEGSDTSATTGFTTLLQSTALGVKKGNVKMCRWMRLTVTTAAGTAGLVSASLEQGV